MKKRELLEEVYTLVQNLAMELRDIKIQLRNLSGATPSPTLSSVGECSSNLRITPPRGAGYVLFGAESGEGKEKS